MLSKLKKLLQWRVTTWYISYSGWRDDNPDFRVDICLQEDVWYWRFLEWLFWDLGLVSCSLVRSEDHGWRRFLKLPKFILNIKRVWDKEWDPEPSTFEEWFGDDLTGIVHCHFEDPIDQWVWRHQFKHQKYWRYSITLDEAKKLFKDDPEKLKWVIESSEEHKRWDAEKAADDLAKNKE
jgi:hypothetical protein